MIIITLKCLPSSLLLLFGDVVCELFSDYKWFKFVLLPENINNRVEARKRARTTTQIHARMSPESVNNIINEFTFSNLHQEKTRPRERQIFNFLVFLLVLLACVRCQAAMKTFFSPFHSSPRTQRYSNHLWTKCFLKRKRFWLKRRSQPVSMKLTRARTSAAVTSFRSSMVSSKYFTCKSPVCLELSCSSFSNSCE